MSLHYQQKMVLTASGIAIASVTFLILLKFYAYAVSHSVTMLGSLTDSVVDLVVSVMLLFAVLFALKPADETHRHGHGKAEGLAALMQSGFLAGAAMFVLFEALERGLNPVPLTNHKSAVIITLIAIAFSLMITVVQKFVLRRVPSLIIESDHAHYKADILLNLGVLAALGIHYYQGPVWVDSAFAILIAAYFLYTAWQIAGQSIDMLMDRECGEDVRQTIEKIVAANEKIYGMHDLRTRMTGIKMHISFDVELSPALTLQAAHDIVRALDQDILQAFPDSEIIIHMDPIGDTADPRHHVDGEKLS